ncbi:MAG: hypothetical protein U1F34_01795 [Gammaproteobacteria bacterium]
MAAEESENELQRTRRFGVRIAGAGFLVTHGVASEVVHQPQLFPLRRVVPYLADCSMSRPTAIPVFDIRPLLQSGSTANDLRYADSR